MNRGTTVLPGIGRDKKKEVVLKEKKKALGSSGCLLMRGPA